jgi:hypothetical protein
MRQAFPGEGAAKKTKEASGSISNNETGADITVVEAQTL